MSLDLPQVLPQVNALAEEAARRLENLEQLLRHANDGLSQAGQLERSAILERIARAGEHWPGAIPTLEPLEAAFECPPLPPEFNVVAADGSQVYPDRHSLSLFYLINTGSICVRAGRGTPPETVSRPQVVYEEEDLYGQFDGLIPSAMIDGQRDVAEMAELARLGAASKGKPTLAILDNGLLLWVAHQAGISLSPQVGKLLASYLEHLGELKSADVAVAGFIDRPRNDNVLSLIHLASATQGAGSEESGRRHPWRGLTDRALFSGRLRPFQRSARFQHASPVNQRFRDAGHAVEFFYLCLAQGHIVRVEIPAWVGERPELLGFVHAGLVDQCSTPEGFPYALVRAHELAVVTMEDRQALEDMLAGALLDRGLSASPSRKSQTKQWTGARRRHRL